MFYLFNNFVKVTSFLEDVSVLYASVYQQLDFHNKKAYQAPSRRRVINMQEIYTKMKWQQKYNKRNSFCEIKLYWKVCYVEVYVDIEIIIRI